MQILFKTTEKRCLLCVSHTETSGDTDQNLDRISETNSSTSHLNDNSADNFFPNFHLVKPSQKQSNVAEFL